MCPFCTHCFQSPPSIFTVSRKFYHFISLALKYHHFIQYIVSSRNITRFSELRKLFDIMQEGHSRPTVVRVLEDFF
jgi:hypothetical protein